MALRETAPCGIRFKNHALAGAAIHDDRKRCIKPQMAYAALFFERSLVRQPLPVDEPFPGIGVHGEISDLEGCEVLKKMAALRGGDSEIAEPSFNDDSGSGDFVPLHRDAEPWLG